METKSVRLDLRCEGDDGTRFIVEMQQSGQRHFFIVKPLDKCVGLK